ncbi:MAG: SAM-dependent methyltransferase [Gammaproteobacteria bacterium]
MTISPAAIYITKPEFLDELCAELGEVTEVIGNMVFSPVKKRDACFALDVWINPVVVNFESISEAANLLRKAGRFWHLDPQSNVRRSLLIAEQLRKTPNLIRPFPIEEPIPEVGCFTLLDKNTLVYATKRWKKWPLGICQFVEDKKNPPNRAYLKLWEALSLLDTYPQKGETAVDLGASPGGWTYVMQQLGTQVTSIDKAALDPAIAALPHVKYLSQSAFALTPSEWPNNIDWLLSDIACYPERLYEYLTKWMAANKAKHIIFTIKLQGETNLEMIKQFQAIPNSRTTHLYHNKHEATFFYPAPDSLFPDFE